MTDVYPQRNDPDPSWWVGLRQISIRVLVIAGGESSHIAQAQMREMAEQIPAAELRSIDCGHNEHATCPDEFAAAVNEILDG